jgi:hypothetical protein
MSFLDKYLENHGLGSVPQRMKERVARLEEKLNTTLTDSGGNFDECVKSFGPQLADISSRLGQRIKGMRVQSFRDAWELVKFAKNIGFEIYQVVDAVRDCVFKDGLTGEAAKQREIAFGKDLAYFVWLTANPLKDRFDWLPFKKTIEEKLVKWIAGMAIELAYDMLNKSFKASSLDGVESDVITLKVL